MKAARGFTLLELLVVISIIGLLASIVFASVRSARTRAVDTSIRSTLVGVRAEADLFYSTASSYEGVCAYTGTHVIGDQVLLAETTYDNLVGFPGFSDGTASTFGNGQCHDSVGAWAAIVPLKASANAAIIAFCVDSTGAGKQVSAALAGNTYACP